MDLWAESKANRTGGQEDSKKYFEMANGDFAPENATKKRKSKKTVSAQQPNERPSPNQRSKMAADERNLSAVTRHDDQRRADKRTQADTAEEDELEEEDEEEDFGVECRNKNNNNNNNSNNSNSNKFYGNNQECQQERRGGGNGFEVDKYVKSSSSASSESDDESTITIPEPGRKVEHIAQKLEQTAQKYAREPHSPPKFLERRERTNAAAEYKSLERETREAALSRERRERSAVEYKSLERSRDGQKNLVERLRDNRAPRDDERPPLREDKHSLEQSCREDRQNFGRLRDDKQSFERAREDKQRSLERLREDKQRSLERSREDKQIFERSREDKQSSDRSREDKRSFQRSREEAQSYERARARSRNDQERAYANAAEQQRREEQQRVTSYERTFEKNRNRMIERLSSRRFERPRPPSREAPERPVGASYRERRYSDKEEAIYGEAGRDGIDSLERDRGYESNFETKLERSKVIERHGYHAGLPGYGPGLQKRNAVPRSSEQSNHGDTNNNTLKMDRKSPRQGQITAMGHLAQTGGGRAFEDSKSPKLVKRTKSFWKFRRDSEVLEGMALWQHRSLVDIPKMIRKEDGKMAGNAEEKQRNSDGGSPNSSLGNSESTITNEHRHDETTEPKPAERSHVPPADKTDYFDDFPTPAERPKITERSAYRIQQQSEERAYFVGNVSRRAIIEKERKRSLEAKRNMMIVAELKENNENKRNEMSMRDRRNYDEEEEDATLNFSETEASDEESTYSCIVVKDQSIPEKTLLPRTKLRRESDRDRNTCGPWYDLWGMDASVNKKKRKQKQQ